MTSAELRKAFLEFFRARDHEIVPSASLVPAHDPTLLFTNAGMVPFKDAFLGREHRDNPRAVSCQRCVRAGGKHNDLENVGYTARHHTFFEMLGNFSFGDYFKEEAIRYGWDFLTGTLGLPADKLTVTVYETDDEAYEIWAGMIGIPAERLIRIGDKPGGGSDNFWQMGDTGPCGPCTEIFYDHGPEVPGGPPGSPDEDGDRFIEIWNIVFMQYDRDESGTLTPLPKPSVDTGMGLERLAAVVQGVHSNYDTDIFQRLIREAAALTGAEDLSSSSLKVLADHIRSCAFLVADGILPGNEGRGYVLRRIIRRAARHGHKLGQDRPFFHKLVDPLVELMGEAYPELAAGREQIARVLKQEEERFIQTLSSGMGLLEDALRSLSSGDTLDGELVFRLYDTHGFPFDLTADIARERGVLLDEAGFEQAMARQRAQSRAASHFSVSQHAVDIEVDTCFEGYEKETETGRVVALLQDGHSVSSLPAGTEGVVILDRTAFYAESGGQVGDTGVLVGEQGRFVVSDTQKQGGAFAHIGRMVEGSLCVDQTVETRIDAERRQAIRLNHSATHLLHAALRAVLGPHVQQKGSRVAPDELRFDFSHPEPISPETLAQIEAMVNEQVRRNAAVETRVMPIEAARAAGAMALFGEKYSDEVRVVTMGEFSMELCGGTHARRVGDIGLFKIVGEGGVAAGIRRIEAVTGAGALQWVREADEQLGRIAALVKGARGEAFERVEQLVQRGRQLERDLAELKGRLASQAGGDLAAQALDINGVRVLAASIEGADQGALRDTVDQLKNKLGTAAIVLATVDDGKVRLVAGVTPDLTDRIKAGALVNVVAEQVGGKGGGRPDLAQAGGNDPAALPAALDSARAWLQAQVE
ncbi:MAG: alanine--tRNA ligase [Halothiobacillaceae bacterium]